MTIRVIDSWLLLGYPKSPLPPSVLQYKQCSGGVFERLTAATEAALEGKALCTAESGAAPSWSAVTAKWSGVSG